MNTHHMLKITLRKWSSSPMVIRSVYQYWMLNVIRCIFRIDDIIVLFSFLYYWNGNRFPILNHPCITGINPTWLGTVFKKFLKLCLKEIKLKYNKATSKYKTKIITSVRKLLQLIMIILRNMAWRILSVSI